MRFERNNQGTNAARRFSRTSGENSGGVRYNICARSCLAFLVSARRIYSCI